MLRELEAAHSLKWPGPGPALAGRVPAGRLGAGSIGKVPWRGARVSGWRGPRRPRAALLLLWVLRCNEVPCRRAAYAVAQPRFRAQTPRPRPRPRFVRGRGPGLLKSGTLPRSRPRFAEFSAAVRYHHEVDLRQSVEIHTYLTARNGQPMTPLTAAAAATSTVRVTRSPPGSQLQRNCAVLRMSLLVASIMQDADAHYRRKRRRPAVVTRPQRRSHVVADSLQAVTMTSPPRRRRRWRLRRAGCWHTEATLVDIFQGDLASSTTQANVQDTQSACSAFVQPRV